MTDLLVDLMALLLDLANIAGGFLLAAALLARPAGAPAGGVAGGVTGGVAGGGGWAARGTAVRGAVARAAAVLARVAPVVGIVALVSGGYWLLVHATSGPHLFHYELVGLAVGAVLLWDRLTGRPSPWGRDAAASGAGLVLGVLGLIAVVVGLQGLVTPNG